MIVTNWRWPHFAPQEVLSPAGLLQLERDSLMVQTHALDFLERYRVSLGVPLIINFSSVRFRGYRSMAENNAAGGSLLSRHLQGIAFDMHSPELTTHELAEAAKAFGWTGIGIYSTFIHHDCRPLYKRDEPIIWYG